MASTSSGSVIPVPDRRRADRRSIDREGRPVTTPDVEAPRQRTSPPYWFTACIVGAIMTVMGVIPFTIWEINRRQADREQLCELAVEIRAAHRSMWIALFEAFPDAAEESGLTRELGVRLPALQCVDAQFVPLG